MFNRLAQIFLTGLVAALPLILTVAVIAWVGSIAATYIGPNSSVGQLLRSIGLGVTASEMAPYLVGVAAVLAGLFGLGLLVETRLGGWLSSAAEIAIQRVPVISGIYGFAKRFTAIVDRRSDDSLSGMSPVWCFFGGEPGAAVFALLASPTPVRIGANDYLGVLIPSAPVPVGGALVYVPSSWVRPAEGGVEHLMGVYVSMGVTPPKSTPRDS